MAAVIEAVRASRLKVRIRVAVTMPAETRDAVDVVTIAAAVAGSVEAVGSAAEAINKAVAVRVAAVRPQPLPEMTPRTIRRRKKIRQLPRPGCRAPAVVD